MYKFRFEFWFKKKSVFKSWDLNLMCFKGV